MDDFVAEALKTDLFCGVDPAVLRVLLRKIDAQRLQVKKGEVIAQEGTEARVIYMIVSGRLVISEHAYGGRNHVVRDLASGIGFGLTLLLAPSRDENSNSYWNTPYGDFLGQDRIPRWPGSVQAVEDSVLIGIDLLKTRTSCEDPSPVFHRIRLNLMHMLCEHLANIWLKLTVLDSHSIEDRIMMYLHRLDIGGERTGVVTVPFNRNQLACYLGLNRTALSRSLSKLRAAGKIDCRKNVFRLMK